MLLLPPLMAIAMAKPRARPARDFAGPDHSQVDLLRPFEGGPRIFVQATLPNGVRGLFLVDTGADISVLSSKAAEALQLENLVDANVWGLSGSAQVQFGMLPSLTIGEMTVNDIQVAVDVPGFNDQIGYMDLHGLIGNNVWSKFTLELDYPADVMVLHAPDAVELPRSATPMHFDGSHVFTPITLSTAGEAARTEEVVVQVDTGAGQLTLCAATGLPFEDGYTQGLETVRGIGASETLPPFRFLEMTRRIPLTSVHMGGADVDVGIPARWMAYEDLSTFTCGGSMRALIGHEYLADYRVWFDYANGQIALRKSKRPARQINGHQILYEQELAAHGEVPERGLARAKLLLGAGNEPAFVSALRDFIDADIGDAEERAEARVLLAQRQRRSGHHDEAWRLLKGIDPGDLVDQHQLVGTVNGLLMEERAEEALALAKRGVAARPDDGWALVALADVHLHLGEHNKAQQALLESARLEQYRDAHLLRRARVALAAGDRYGSMAHIRRLLDLYPGGGPYLWFYAMLLEGDFDADTFRYDLQAAMARLHPHTQPFDFLVASHAILGEQGEVDRWLRTGLTEHCEPMPDGPSNNNCVAWYEALAGVRLDDALRRINGALEETGPRADFLDTKAMVHLARREFTEARRAAGGAARMSPDDVYMLWQAERIAEIALASQRETGRAPEPEAPVMAGSEAP